MTNHAQESSSIVVPVVVEEPVVAVVTQETGRVRVQTTVEEREVQVEGVRTREEVHVERVPMERVVEGPLPIRQEGDTTVLSVVEDRRREALRPPRGGAHHQAP